MNIFKSLSGLSGAVLALGLIAAAPANATVTEGDASAHALQVNLFGDPLLGPIPNSSVSGNGTDSDSVVSLTVAPFLSTGILNSSASSNVDGSSGPKEASASSSIVDFDFGVPALLGLSFDLISSNSSVTGDAGSFNAVGSSSILNLYGSGLLAGLNGVVITGAPNQTLLSLAGVEVIANRQTSSCSATDCFMTTDALYVSALGITDVTLASSTAHLAAPVPEPASAALMMAGLAGLGKRLRRKQRAA